jgi:hypothetical protein
VAKDTADGGKDDDEIGKAEATSSEGGTNIRPITEATNSSQGSAQGSLGLPQQVLRELSIFKKVIIWSEPNIFQIEAWS